MAKEKDKGLSLDDFNEENLFDSSDEQEEVDDVNEGQEEEESEEEEEKPASKKKKKKTTIIEEEEEEAEPKKKAKKKPVSKKTEKAEEEEEEEEEEINTDPSDPEEEEESEEEEQEDVVEPIKFFEEVQKITGVEVDVDYGGIDPLTPQGVALREKALGMQVLDNFLGEIEQNHPKLFMAFKHAYAGGDIESLFQKATQRDYSKLEIKEGDDALAKQVLDEYYLSKGVKNEKKRAQLIQAEEDSEEGLIKAAQSVAKEMAEEQAEGQKATLAKQQEAAAAQKRKDQAFVSSIAEIVDTGKIDTFKLAGKQEIEAFKNFLMSNVSRTADGGYAFTTVIQPKDLTKVLQYEYFKFKGGDLGKLITIKSSTENANKLRLKVKGEQQKAKGTGAEGSSSQRLSLKDFQI